MFCWLCLGLPDKRNKRNMFYLCYQDAPHINKIQLARWLHIKIIEVNA
jgi:hypothetical protein